VTKPGDHSAAGRGERTGPVTESAAPGRATSFDLVAVLAGAARRPWARIFLRL